MTKRHQIWLAAALSSCFIFACDSAFTDGDDGSAGSGAGSSGSGSGAGMSTSTSSGDPSMPLFETDIVPIFEQSCGTDDNKCHTRVAFGANGAEDCRGWLSLENSAIGSLYYAGADEGNPTGCPDMDLYTRLMKAAWQCGAPNNDGPLVPYVVPCDPDGSYVVRKMEGRLLCNNPDPNGTQFTAMPPDVEANQADIDVMRTWIANGAPRVNDPGVDCDPTSSSSSTGGGAMNPVPNISHPGDGETRPPNQPIPFIGAANDPQDGELSGGSLLWYSSLDGQIGSGQQFSQSLSAGVHTITLEATDSDGNVGAVSIMLNISN